MKNCRLLPQPDEERLLQAALLPGDGAIAAWEAWRRANAPESSGYACRRLFPLAYRNLREAGVAEGDLEGLRESYARTRQENADRMSAARPVVEALVGAGIEVLLLKGAALARFYEGDLGLRPMRDVDILVPSREAKSAVSRLAGMGYLPADIGPDCLERLAFSSSPGWSFVSPDGPEIDLHWHVLHDSCQSWADEEFWSGARPLRFEGVEVRMLNATDQLFHVCVHGLHPERGKRNLRWVADAARIIGQEVEPIDWQRLVGQAIRRRLVLQIRRCFEYLTTAFAAPIPAEVSRELVRERVSWIERAEIRERSVPGPTRGPIRRAVLAHQREVRWGRMDPTKPFRKFLPRYFWGARGWWQPPLWRVVDRFGLAPRPQTAFSRWLFAAPPAGSRRGPAPTVASGRWLRFRRGGNGLATLGAGWSVAEGAGVWSDAVLAHVDFRLEAPGRGPWVLQAELGAAIVGGPKRPLDVHVLVNSSRVARWRFVAPMDESTVHLATIPTALLGGEGLCAIEFRILCPRSPASLGIGEDERLLGIYLSALRILSEPG